MDRPAEYKKEKLTQGVTEDENKYFLASFLPSVIPRPISKERRKPREKGAYTVGHRIPPSVAPGRFLHVEQRQGIAAAHRRSVVFPVAAWDLVWFQAVQGVTAAPVPGPLPAARLAGTLAAHVAAATHVQHESPGTALDGGGQFAGHFPARQAGQTPRAGQQQGGDQGEDEEETLHGDLTGLARVGLPRLAGAGCNTTAGTLVWATGGCGWRNGGGGGVFVSGGGGDGGDGGGGGAARCGEGHLI